MSEEKEIIAEEVVVDEALVEELVPAAIAAETSSEGSSADRRGRGRGERGDKRRSGPPRKERAEKEYQEEVLQIDRVTRVVKGGRRLRFRVTVILGDSKGRVGLGIGKSAEVMGGIQKAISKAKKAMMNVQLVNNTIPHPIKIKYKSARILMMPASEGKGIIAGSAVRKICELAGIKNVIAKIFGTNNKIVNAQATMRALATLYPPRKAEKTAEEKTVKTEKAPVEKAEQKTEKKPAEKA